jgi:D-glycero-alpha-D-manno-heptose-7-phosphate kinase
MELTRIKTRAPTRIDLAGGTVDIWPLYLFLQGPLTINLGIDLFAETELTLGKAKSDGAVTLIAEDQKIEKTIPWAELTSARMPAALDLHMKLLRFFIRLRERAGVRELGFDMRLVTRAKSPAGAGLGGSSSLNISLVGALATWARSSAHVRKEWREITASSAAIDPVEHGESLIGIARDVETTVIQVPAGLQDYYGAMYGGLQCLRWRPGSHRRQWLPDTLLPELEKRLMLFYSGQSRNSGINNWVLFKNFIDQQAGVREKFQEISAATHLLEDGLKEGDWEKVGMAISEEWAVRRTLAPGITTPELDKAFAEARKIMPVAGKVCGAGGGGCFFVYLPDGDAPESARNRIREAFSSLGIKPLPFKPVTRGLEIETG